MMTEITAAQGAASGCASLCRFSVRDYARAKRLNTRCAVASFRLLMEHVPALSEHIEARRYVSRNGIAFMDYLMDDLAYCAWLAWRDRKGHLPQELMTKRRNYAD